MRRASALVADQRAALRREVLALAGLVVAVDAVFIGLYYAAQLSAAGPELRTGYTVLWTAVTLAIVLRSLGRIRAARLGLRRSGR